MLVLPFFIAIWCAIVLCADCAGLDTALELAPVRMHSRSEHLIALRYIQGAGLAGLLCGRARTGLPQTGSILRVAYLSQNNHSPLAELLSLASDESGRRAVGRKWEGLRMASLPFSGMQAESVTNWTSSSDCFSEVQSLGPFSQCSWSRLVCSNLLQVCHTPLPECACALTIMGNALLIVSCRCILFRRVCPPVGWCVLYAEASC